jgi:hypothetical protein
LIARHPAKGYKGRGARANLFDGTKG